MLRYVWLLLCLIACGGSAMPALVPDDFSVVYDWREGSLPPPYHNEYTITIQHDGQSTITYWPDYPSDITPKWSETWMLTEDQLQTLYTQLVQQQFFATTWSEDADPPVGGSIERLSVQAAGKTYTAPFNVRATQQAALEPLYALINNAVPEKIWQQLEQQRQTYIDQFEE